MQEDARIRKYIDGDDVIAFLIAVGNIGKIVRPRSKFRVMKDDPSDDIILRTAYDGKADCIVSGDKHLLALREFRGMRIVTVDEMLKMLKEK